MKTCLVQRMSTVRSIRLTTAARIAYQHSTDAFLYFFLCPLIDNSFATKTRTKPLERTNGHHWSAFGSVS